MTALAPKISVVIQNDSGAMIPERSVVVVTSMETTAATETNESITIAHVAQYGCGKPGNILITGPTSIGPGKIGLGFVDQLVYVSVDPSIADPAPGEQWGPSDGSWVLTKTKETIGFFAMGHSANGGSPKRSMFLRNFMRQASSVCSSSSSSASTSGSKTSTSVSGSSSSSGSCGCITVVTSVSCGSGGLSVTYGQARGCC